MSFSLNKCMHFKLHPKRNLHELLHNVRLFQGFTFFSIYKKQLYIKTADTYSIEFSNHLLSIADLGTKVKFTMDIVLYIMGLRFLEFIQKQLLFPGKLVIPYKIENNILYYTDGSSHFQCDKSLSSYIDYLAQSLSYALNVDFHNSGNGLCFNLSSLQTTNLVPLLDEHFEPEYPDGPTDFKIVAGAEYNVHKEMLMQCGDFFSTCIKSGFKEVDDQRINLEKYGKDQVCYLVDFIYGRKLSVENVDLVQLYVLAESLMWDKFRNHVVNLYSRYASNEHLYSLKKLSQVYENPWLKMMVVSLETGSI